MEHRITITLDDADHAIVTRNILFQLSKGIFGAVGRLRVEIRGNIPEPVDLRDIDEFLRQQPMIGMG